MLAVDKLYAPHYNALNHFVVNTCGAIMLVFEIGLFGLFMFSVVHAENRTPENVGHMIVRRLRPALFVVAIIVASYLFISALSYEARQGDRTLSWFSPLVTLLRRLGHLIAQNTEQIATTLILFPVLGVAAVVTLILLRRFHPLTWQHDIALALVVPSLVATAALMLRGDFVPATLTGLLAGICLVVLGAVSGEQTEQEPSAWLFLIPLGTRCDPALLCS